ncbi:MAG: aminopeptidase P family protein [Myxococcaceae bacterium]|nr:aminopeptidase P family protein [Myxococcaceae bacterium]
MGFAQRRRKLLTSISRPLLLLSGGEVARNYPQNPFPFRADSNFLYFFDSPEPGSAAWFDPGAGTVTLFIPQRTLDDTVWHGPRASFDEVKAAQGVDAVRATEGLEAFVLEAARGRSVDAIAVADARANYRARALTGQDLVFEDASRVGRPDVVLAVSALRMTKDAEEIAHMRATAEVTREGHLAAMAATQKGRDEQWLVGALEGVFARHGCVPAYRTILSVRGEVLHNHDHRNELLDGDMVLLDGGAEGVAGYCSDVTRCWPVNGRFSSAAAEVYDCVLAAQQAAIARVRAGVRYRDVHTTASLELAKGLVAMGLCKGDPAALVESGAHALFFPHGIGHLIGLDVHDMEAFGDLIQYPNGRRRSTQFGTAYLRLDADLEPGMTVTIEPGLYFVPAIIRSSEFRQKFAGQVDFERAEAFLKMNNGRGFGGIRIEDDVLCTGAEPVVLTEAIPKQRGALEPLIGVGGT